MFESISENLVIALEDLQDILVIFSIFLCFLHASCKVVVQTKPVLTLSEMDRYLPTYK